MRAVGISLWLIPEAEARKRLAATIADLARRLGTPAFDPHVTLIGSLGQPADSIVAVAERLAANTAPLPLRAARVGHRSEYFRCVFLEIAADAALNDLQLQARLAFSRLSDPAFLAHLSLAYGDVPEAVKQALAGVLEIHRGDNWLVDELQVVRTEGEVGDWRLLGAFPLSRRD